MHFSTIIQISTVGFMLARATPLQAEEARLEARASKYFIYNCQKTPQICLNTCWAINCRGLPSTLHGGAGVSSGANRDAWGYSLNSRTSWSSLKWGVNTPPENRSPDEYPYASSMEGGLNGGGTTLALRCVPGSEQSSQGGTVSGIGSAPNTDTFITDPSKFTNLPHLATLTHPTAGATYDWCNTNSQCVNDGHQYTATSMGVYVLG